MTKMLVIYDSKYRNKEKIARAISGAFHGEVSVVCPDRVIPADLKSLDFLVVGSPTQGFRATMPVQEFLDNIPDRSLNGLFVAAFDTRMNVGGIGGFIVRRGGYAAPRTARVLQKKGGVLAAPPEGFFVLGSEGPLKEGELERATEWARGLAGKGEKRA